MGKCLHLEHFLLFLDFFFKPTLHELLFYQFPFLLSFEKCYNLTNTQNTCKCFVCLYATCYSCTQKTKVVNVIKDINGMLRKLCLHVLKVFNTNNFSFCITLASHLCLYQGTEVSFMKQHGIHNKSFWINSQHYFVPKRGFRQRFS